MEVGKLDTNNTEKMEQNAFLKVQEVKYKKQSVGNRWNMEVRNACTTPRKEVSI